jgi:hypothetical protein
MVPDDAEIQQLRRRPAIGHDSSTRALRRFVSAMTHETPFVG